MSARFGVHDIAPGTRVLVDGEPCVVVATGYVNPGRYQAFNRVKLRHLRSGRTLERTLHGSETLEIADIVDVEAEYLYRDDLFWHFMDPRNHESLAADAAAMAPAHAWLKGNETCTITLWNSAALLVTPSPFVELRIVATEPGLRGDTAGGGNKAATLETGPIVRVPLFVSSGDVVRVDTRSAGYVSRVR